MLVHASETRQRLDLEVDLPPMKEIEQQPARQHIGHGGCDRRPRRGEKGGGAAEEDIGRVAHVKHPLDKIDRDGVQSDHAPKQG